MKQNLTADFTALSKEADHEKVKTAPLLQAQATILMDLTPSMHRPSSEEISTEPSPNTCSALGELPGQQGEAVPASHTQPWLVSVMVLGTLHSHS